MNAPLLIATGLGLLVALAWIIGRVEANARDGAWQRIAVARRRLRDDELHLLACLEGPRCADCPIRLRSGDLRGS